MRQPSKSRISGGLILFLTGLALEAVAVLVYFDQTYAALVPISPLLAHIAAAALIALGAALTATARVGIAQALGLSILFATLTLILPAVGPLAIATLAAILAWHSWHQIPTEINLAKVTAPEAPNTARCPVSEPLVGLLGRIPHAELQQALLGMSKMPPRETRPLLKTLQKHDDVRVLLYANGLLNDHLNTFEKRLAGLQEQLDADPRNESTLTAIVETYAELIEHKLIPPDETSQTAKRALAMAESALAINPDNIPVLTAKARFELLIADFQTAYLTILALYPLPGCSRTARALHAELLFEHAATRPVNRVPQLSRTEGADGSQTWSATRRMPKNAS